MIKRVLITGGAGFIGSHISALLLERGYEIRVLDSLNRQVHSKGSRPDYLPVDVELIEGDVRDRSAVRDAVAGAEAVIHLAAAVGVGQSMYEMASYAAINDVGTAVLLEEISRSEIQRLITASSMSIYGEGLAKRPNGQIVEPADRSLQNLRERCWELSDSDGTPLRPIATTEAKHAKCGSVYALTKHAQEQLSLIAGRAYGIPTVALRLFNVYGPHQALSNPYTGVLAIFASRLMNNKPPAIFEDGLQLRDFVHVRDVARSFVLALEAEHVSDTAINIGSGEARTILSIAEDLTGLLGREFAPEITGRYRMGDIRHCFADIGQARALLGYHPTVAFRDGLGDLVEWLNQKTADDRVAVATAELEARGLVT